MTGHFCLFWSRHLDFGNFRWISTNLLEKNDFFFTYWCFLYSFCKFKFIWKLRKFENAAICPIRTFQTWKFVQPRNWKQPKKFYVVLQRTYRAVIITYYQFPKIIFVAQSWFSKIEENFQILKKNTFNAIVRRCWTKIRNVMHSNIAYPKTKLTICHTPPLVLSEARKRVCGDLPPRPLCAKINYIKSEGIDTLT